MKSAFHLAGLDPHGSADPRHPLAAGLIGRFMEVTATADLKHARQRQKGVEATRPDADIRHLNCARQIVYKMLACRPGSEYG